MKEAEALELKPSVVNSFIRNDEDDSSLSLDSNVEPPSSNSFRSAFSQEVLTSRSCKIKKNLHVSFKSPPPVSCTDIHSSAELSHAPLSSEDKSDNDKIILDMDFSCMPKALSVSLTHIEPVPNEDHSIHIIDDSDLKVCTPVEPEIRIDVTSIVQLPSKEGEEIWLDLKELLLDGKFCSENIKKPKSIMHLEVMKRHKDLLSKCVNPKLTDFLLSPQEVSQEEYAVPSPSRSFMSIIKSIIDSPTVRPEQLLFQFNISKESLAFNQKVLENFHYNMEKLIPAFTNM